MFLDIFFSKKYKKINFKKFVIFSTFLLGSPVRNRLVDKVYAYSR